MTIATRVTWDGGIGIDTDSSGGDFDPVVDLGTAFTAPAGASIVALTVDDTTTTGARTVPTVRTQAATRLRHRIVVGSKDVTNWRGVRTPLPTYSLVSPFLYGSGSLSLPQIHAALETPGEGDLAFLKKFAKVKVQRLNASGAVIATDFVGFVADFPPAARDFTCTLGGQATGTAAMLDRPLPIFPGTTDAGTLITQAISNALRLPVANQPTTGIKVSDSGGGSQLDFLTATLALTTEKDGTQWTVAPNSDGKYRMFRKDTTTIAATVYIDGFRVVESLKRDFTEEPNRIWASGIGPDGRRIRFADFPGLVAGPVPDFPGTLSPGDSGAEVTEMMWRLFYCGLLDGAPLGLDWTTDADDDVTNAIQEVQDRADLSQTGVVNEATWKAIFRKNPFSLRGAAIRPAAQRSYTEAFLRDATGAVIGKNPAYDRTRKRVDRTIEVGSRFTQRRIHRFAKRQMADDSTSNWVGTVTVNTGAVIDGEHNPGDALTSGLVRDVRTIQPGHNLWLPNWDGGTLVHVSGVNVSPGSVEFAVDTRARDTMPVWQVITNNRQSRISPERQWIAQNRRSGLRDDTGAFYDGGAFGRIPRTLLTANTWTVIEVPAGVSGVLQMIETQTEDPVAYGLSVWGKKVTSSWLDRKLGDPFDVDGVTFGVPYFDHVDAHQDDWIKYHGLIDIFGDADQPCGYGSRIHTKADGTTSDAVINGFFRFRAGAPYFCQDGPSLWLAIRTGTQTHLEGGRVMDLLLSDAAG